MSGDRHFSGTGEIPFYDDGVLTAKLTTRTSLLVDVIRQSYGFQPINKYFGGGATLGIGVAGVSFSVSVDPIAKLLRVEASGAWLGAGGGVDFKVGLDGVAEYETFFGANVILGAQFHTLGFRAKSDRVES